MQYPRRNRHVKKKAINTLVTCDHLYESGLVGYGKNRNNVLMKAMLTGSDILIFVDTDVYPKLLVETVNGVIKQEIDFIGEHMKYLSLDSVMISTSDYSGYYIIPPMKFKGMEYLYRGLQKDGVCDFFYKLEWNIIVLFPPIIQNASRFKPIRS